jgi:purine-nucleoside phosphorylase
MIDKKQLDGSWKAIADQVKDLNPQCGVILGSGWSDAVNRLDKILEIPYEDIPGLGKTGVVGHAGKLTFTQVGNTCAMIFQGRRHFYEGIGWTPIAIPVYLTIKTGATHLLLTNAAGGIRKDLSPGSLMVISDHINRMPSHPLIGPHDKTWGPRFPDQSKVYDPGLRSLLETTAGHLEIPLSSGVYLASSGPTYETPTEVNCYQSWGADAVGMSTVPEAILGSSAGLKVLALSCISNFAAGIMDQPLSHEEVTETTQAAMPKMEILLKGFLEALG